jgi:hypothetical protein
VGCLNFLILARFVVFDEADIPAQEGEKDIAHHEPGRLDKLCVPPAIDLSRLSLLLWRDVPGGYDPVSSFKQARGDAHGVTRAVRSIPVVF